MSSRVKCDVCGKMVSQWRDLALVGGNACQKDAPRVLEMRY